MRFFGLLVSAALFRCGHGAFDGMSVTQPSGSQPYKYEKNVMIVWTSTPGAMTACPTVNVKLYQGAAMSGDDDFAYAYVATLEAEYPNDHEETSFGWIRLCRIQMRSLA